MLSRKSDDARNELALLDEERTSIAFMAHTGDADAMKRLSGLNKKRLGLLADIEMIECALVEADRRIEAADREAAALAEAERAARAIEIAGELSALAERLDASLAKLAEDGNAFKELVRELNHRIGCPNPNEFQFQSLGERAVKSGLMFSPFRIEHLAPRERRTFENLAQGWQEAISNWAMQRLPKKDEAA
jgi:hypothetical protein